MIATAPSLPPDAGLKECRKCGNLYPRDPQYFHRDVTHPDGFKSRCRTCRKGSGGKRPRRAPKPPLDPEAQLKSEARVAAIKRLIEDHYRDFRRILAEELQSRRVKKTWQSLN